MGLNHNAAEATAMINDILDRIPSENLTVDHLLVIASIRAQLAIADELAYIRTNGIRQQ